MKKLWKVTVISILSLMLAACGAGGETPEPTLAPTSTPLPTATPTPTPADDYAMGVVTETGFESEWMNLRFTTPPDAVMATQEEIYNMMGIGIDAIYGEQAEAVMDQMGMTTVIEMYATWIYGMPNVQVMAEKVAFENVTTDQYITSLLYTLQNTPGITCESDGTVATVEIAGEEYSKLTISLDYGTGVKVYQDYYVRKKGSRMIAIVFSYMDGFETILETAVNCFAPY